MDAPQTSNDRRRELVQQIFQRDRRMRAALDAILAICKQPITPGSDSGWVRLGFITVEAAKGLGLDPVKVFEDLLPPPIPQREPEEEPPAVAPQYDTPETVEAKMEQVMQIVALYGDFRIASGEES